jgi:hypothetical protein
MEQKFKKLISASLAEAMPTLINDAAEALKADRKFEWGSSKQSRSTKSVEKTKSIDKSISDSESSLHISEDSSYHGSSPSSTDSTDEPKKKKHRDIKLDQSHLIRCTYRNFLACKPSVFKGINPHLMLLDGSMRWKPLLMLMDVRQETRCDSQLTRSRAKRIFDGRLFLTPGEERRLVVWVGRGLGRYF